ncbi:hypothetical protein NL529_31480, partial [Klebsiella pneumoniae]|nr:hypothetical protein [Klebsiella pneumoniae]
RDTPSVLRSRSIQGRERELAVLARSAVTGGDSGHPAALVVVGEAGVGKSALVRAAVPPERQVVGRAVPSTAAGATPVVELALGL